MFIIVCFYIAHIIIRTAEELKNTAKETAKNSKGGIRQGIRNLVEEHKDDYRYGPKDKRFYLWTAGALAWLTGKAFKGGWGGLKAAGRGIKRGRAEAKIAAAHSRAKKLNKKLDWEQLLTDLAEELAQKFAKDNPLPEQEEPPSAEQAVRPEPPAAEEARREDSSEVPPAAEDRLPPEWEAQVWPNRPPQPQPQPEPEPEPDLLAAIEPIIAEERQVMQDQRSPGTPDEQRDHNLLYRAGLRPNPVATAEDIEAMRRMPEQHEEPQDVVDGYVLEDNQPLAIEPGATTQGENMTEHSGEAMNIAMARDCLNAIASHLSSLLGEVERCAAEVSQAGGSVISTETTVETLIDSLQGMRMDSQTLADGSMIMDHLLTASTGVQEMYAKASVVYEAIGMAANAATATREGMDARHSQLEEAYAAAGDDAADQTAYQPA